MKTYLHVLQLQPYHISGLNILATFIFEREKWMQLEGEKACPAVCIGWLSLSLNHALK